jgi:hypothetical protein
VMPRNFGVALLAIALASIGGCVSASSPLVQEHLKIVSAGHTGCMPDDNVISNVVMLDLAGNATWNATCKGKVYLCTAAGSVGNSESYSCAPVAQ